MDSARVLAVDACKIKKGSTGVEWAKALSDEDWAIALNGGDPRCPPMPDPALQSMFVGSDGLEALKNAGIFFNHVKNAMQRINYPLTPHSRVLDVGVGWGRIYRWALRDIHIENLVGIDVDPSAVDMCKSMMPCGNFHYVPLGHAYPAEKGLYNLVFLYSVFSHLSEEAAIIVLKDIHEALEPGGCLALTTLRLAHIDVWDSLTAEEN